jgi:hypothetical protein
MKQITTDDLIKRLDRLIELADIQSKKLDEAQEKLLKVLNIKKCMVNCFDTECGNCDQIKWKNK